MPVLKIKDPEAYRLAFTLAKHTGKSLTQVVVDALAAEAQRAEPIPRPIDRKAVAKIIKRFTAKLPPDAVLSDAGIYDSRGLPR